MATPHRSKRESLSAIPIRLTREGGVNPTPAAYLSVSFPFEHPQLPLDLLDPCPELLSITRKSEAVASLAAA